MEKNIQIQGTEVFPIPTLGVNNTSHEQLTKVTVSYEGAQFNLNHLQGKILTVIEATVAKENQEATKSIVRSFFVDTHNSLTHISNLKDSLKEVELWAGKKNPGTITA